MEDMGSELEIEDLARLIGDEIPNVASGNAHAEEKGLFSIPVGPYEETSIRNFHGNGNLMDGNVSMSTLQQSSMDQMLTRKDAMPGDQSLALAFEKLNFGGEAKGHTWKSLQGHAIRLEDHYSDNLIKQLVNMDTSALGALDSSNHLINGVHDPHVIRLGHQNSPSRLIPDQYKKWQAGQLQPLETSSPAMPLTYEVANVSAQNLQFPITSQRQQIIHNGQSHVQYIHPQQINRQQMGWNYTEEEQYPYPQHLYIQQRWLPNQSHENHSSRISCQSGKQKYYEVPIARHLEQLNREPSWEACAFHSVSKQLNPAFSTRYMDTVQGMEKVSFPKKILARNTRLNAVDAMRFMSIGADKSANHVDRSRIVRSNSYVRHNNFAPATERIFRNELSSSALYLESANLKLVPERFNSVDEVRGKIFLMAKDQHGCRFLQRKFMEGTDDDIEKIFNEIIDHVVDLMVDPFGNYLVQKLLEVCNEDQRMKFLRRITQNHGEIILVSCDMHGTRAVQKVIETLKTQEQVFMIVSSLKSGMVTLMKNVNGNHVAQHCLDYLMPSSEVLFDAVRNSCVDLATDRHGCCVLQKYLTCSNSVLRDNLISEIAHNALVISQDQYGNYVVQFILRLKRRWYTEAIVKQLEGSFGDLAMQKYSSNVVEKCLESARECGDISKIVLELINDLRFDKIMQDPYGNYAIQTALGSTKGTLHSKLVEAIKLHAPVLRTSPYGKKVLVVLGKSN
ncbi:pumilio homolog 12-like isoform X1 [Cucurbita pepo subsp. pepo]|uniref:pumilio homolog 12-like isoform X1 n=1 Tax=Cucurbita pepo subsp. pepo TaxID=3664 RepID=UPI000C9D330C|nr:pumilio homolog 12-like isoform X1 [Cucurbita pepo subsp. pepo]XP_023529397.1 pumilio homolog 12-like isoform X1 [Cucurbita pepo subsp. pepo]